MADDKKNVAFIYYRVELEYFEAIRKHSISPAPRKIRGRSLEIKTHIHNFVMPLCSQMVIFFGYAYPKNL